jgi:protein-S-isoprenylcysteine O-methyltransferase Ste14
MDASKIHKRALLLYVAALAVVCIVLFVPAGTLDYWQAWAYMAVIFVPATCVILYFLKNDPKFMEKRMQAKEKEATQRLIIKVSGVIFAIGFLLPGLDKRFGWSDVPTNYVIAADALVLLGYMFVFWVFRVNSYASRTIQVEKGQKVISTGPYAMIRHPMYVGMLLLYIATPIALGSYVALPLFLLMIPVIVLRILNEEEVLRRELPGYKEYCKKVSYRLLPFIW